MNDSKSRSKGIFIAPTSLVHEYPFTFQTPTLRHFCIIIQHFHASMHFFSSPGNISRRRGVCLPLSNDAKICPLGRSAIALSGNTHLWVLGYCPLGQYAFAVALLPSRAIRAPGAAMCSLRCAHTPRFFDGLLEAFPCASRISKSDAISSRRTAIDKRLCAKCLQNSGE